MTPAPCDECGDWFDNLTNGTCTECRLTPQMAALAARDHG